MKQLIKAVLIGSVIVLSGLSLTGCAIYSPLYNPSLEQQFWDNMANPQN